MLVLLAETLSLVPITTLLSSEPHGIFHSLLDSAETCTTHALTNHTQGHIIQNEINLKEQTK